RLSEILVSTEQADDDPQKIAAAQAKAEDLLKQIRAGASFEEIAKKNSDGATAAQGGDLGEPFERGKLAKQLEDVTFGLKKDQVSDVIRTKQGFVILKVTEHQAAGIPQFSEIENRLQEAVYMQKLQPALRDYLKKSGEPYLALTLADRSGQIEAKMWDNVEDALDAFEQDDFLKVKGLLNKYKNRFQITIHKLRRMADSEVDFADYLPKTTKNIDE